MCQLVVLKQKTVVTELRCYFVICRSRHVCSDEFLLFNREEPVAVYANNGAFGPYSRKCLFNSSASSSDVVAVNRSAEIPVRIGIETVGKFLSLISLI